MARMGRILAAILMLSAMMALHEYGHASMMMKHGIPIEEFGLGYPIEGVPSLKLVLGGMPVAIHPLLFAAYVKVAQAGEPLLSALPYGDYASIMGAGVWYNLMTFFVLLTGYHALSRSRFPHKQDEKEVPSIPLWPVSLAAVVALYFGQYAFTYIFAFLGILPLALVLMTLYRKGKRRQMPTEKEGFAGMVGGLSQHVRANRLASLLSSLALLAFALAFLNVIPLYSLDGGWVAMRLIEPYTGAGFIDMYKWAGWLFMLFLLAWMLVGDARSISARLWPKKKRS